MTKIIINNKTDILGSIDHQNDFGEDGKLGTKGAKATVAPTNRLSRVFRRVFKSQDWHPRNHGSFASQHNVPPFSMIELDGIAQVAWPDHGINNTWGADFLPDLDLPNTVMIIRKGMNPKIDSYSAFFENDRKTPTGLGGALKELGIRRIFLTGLVRNYCLGFTALDAIALGFEVYVVEDATVAIDDGTNDAMTERLLAAGVKLIHSSDILEEN